MRGGVYFPYSEDLSPREKWEKLKPFWPAVKHGQFARIMLLGLKEWFGVTDLNEQTIEHLGQEVRRQQRTGFYDEALVRKCGIGKIISNGKTWEGYDHDFIRVIVNIPQIVCQKQLREFEQKIGRTIRSVGQLEEALDEYVERAVAAGCVGFKTVVQPVPPLPQSIAPLVQHIIDNPAIPPEAQRQQLASWVHRRCLDAMRGQGKIVAAHAGTYADLSSHPVNFYALMEEYRDIHFDLFHMGIPLTRETGNIAKHLPNVIVNLNGAALTSQHMFEAGLQEWLDFVPVNKVIGFGGDYQWMPQLVWGHLQIMRESYAKVFAARIRRGMIDFDASIDVLRQWLWDNPKRYYRI